METRFDNIRIEKLIKKTREMRHKAHQIELLERFTYKSVSPNTSKRDSSKGSDHAYPRAARKLTPVAPKLSLQKCLSDKSIESKSKNMNKIRELLRIKSKEKTKPPMLFYEQEEKRVEIRYDDTENSEFFAKLGY